MIRLRFFALVSALACLVALAFAAPAAACEAPQPSPLGLFPGNSDTVSPDVDIFVVGEGSLPEDGGEARLIDHQNDPVDFEVELYERPGEFNWLAVYRPVGALATVSHQFFVHYGDPGDEISSRFDVQESESADLREPRIDGWQTLRFRGLAEGECEKFHSVARLTLAGPSAGDTPLWYEVELTTYDEEESRMRAVVPGMNEGDQHGTTRQLRADFDVECLQVTPVGPAGERGEAYRSCEPDTCEEFDAEEAGSDGLWDEGDECNQTPPGEDGSGDGSSGSSSDSSCSVQSSAAPVLRPPSAFLALLLFGLLLRRQNPVRP